MTGLSTINRNGITIQRGCGTHGIMVGLDWDQNPALIPNLDSDKEGRYKNPRISGTMYLTADDVLSLISLVKDLYDDKLRERVDNRES